MNSPYRQTRRSFIRTISGSIALVSLPLPGWADLQNAAGAALPGGQSWAGAAGNARWRIDGLAKVTGQKIYARDFRPRDMPGWPPSERAAMVLRATYTDRLFLGIDPTALPATLQPETIVDAQCLARDHIKLPFPETPPDGRTGGIMAEAGQLPLYYGQPLAILIFKDAATLRAARRELQFTTRCVNYGPQQAPPGGSPPYSPPTYLTRFAEGGEVLFSQVHDGPSNPYDLDDPNPAQQQLNKHAAEWRQRLQAAIRQPGLREFSLDASSQRLDPMFLEPEAGLGWLDHNTQSMHLVLGTQATDGDFQEGAALFGAKECPIHVNTVYLTSCYPGGGFGGRDESPFSTLVTLAAAYANGPVRLAHDRYEQFQAGLKRAGAQMQQTLVVDEQGRFQATTARYRFEAGGKNNYSQFVAELGGYSAGGGYRIPLAAVDAVAQPTEGVVAGSMRGFGGPAACFALETLVDEAAGALGLDAIELRLRNVLQQGDETITGAPLTQAMRLQEICTRARANPLWQERLRPAANGHLRGVGFALANQAYGTGADGVMALVSIDTQGRLAVHSNCVDMGNGSATTLALATAAQLGRNADQAHMGDVEAFAPLRDAFASHPKSGSDHHKQHKLTRTRASAPGAVDPWQDAHYTASFSMSSSACLTAFHQVHVVAQAAGVLFRTGIWPAACVLWQINPDDPQYLGKHRWVGEALSLDGFPTLGWPQLVAALQANRLTAGAMVHGFFAGDWVSADYRVGNQIHHWPIDGLALRTAGAAGYQFIDRSQTRPPPLHASRFGRSLYAPSATLAAVEVDPQSGQVTVTDVYSYLDAGPVLQPELLSGQYQGAVAMGIGATLLEYLPVGAGGAGQGDWNLDRYHPAMAGDIPLQRVQLELLPPISPDDPSKGIAEAVLSPLAPAIANAISAATGQRFTHLPIRPADVRAGLQAHG